MSQVVSLSFYRFDAPLAQLWAFAQMGLARVGMARTPDIGFWKLCGSGTGEGFTPRPNTKVYAILATWPDLETAKARISASSVFKKYQSQSAENWTVFMSTDSVRGQWSGQTPFVETACDTNDRPLGALTRATSNANDPP